MQKEQQHKSLEDEYRNQLDFFKKSLKKKSEQVSEKSRVFHKMYRFFRGMEFYGVMGYCTMGGKEGVKEWGMEPIEEMYTVFSEARTTHEYNQVEDMFSMFEFIQSLRNISLMDDVMDDEKYEATIQLEEDFGKDGVKKLLIYMASVFCAVWDKDGEYWTQYKLKTIFPS